MTCTPRATPNYCSWVRRRHRRPHRRPQRRRHRHRHQHRRRIRLNVLNSRSRYHIVRRSFNANLLHWIGLINICYVMGLGKPERRCWRRSVAFGDERGGWIPTNNNAFFHFYIQRIIFLKLLNFLNFLLSPFIFSIEKST